MADITTPTRKWPKIDGAWLASGAILLLVAIFAREEIVPLLQFTAKNLLNTGVFILFAVFLVAYLRATSAEGLVAKAFQGNQTRMIILAALVGGLMPFCSCEVIPFIAAMLALGTPLSAVMAFWLASPLMDPPMFLITAGELGLGFAIVKTASGVGIGLLGGFTIFALRKTALFIDPLRPSPMTSCGTSCCGESPLNKTINWTFWNESNRVQDFKQVALENAHFLFKWLTLAYVVEGLMIRYIPADWIAGVLGGSGAGPIVLGALVGAPAYLNGYAAVPLISGLLDQGMAPGAAMSFMIAGGISSIPAAMAVYALVKMRVFVAYVGLGVIGAVLSGTIWALLV